MFFTGAVAGADTTFAACLMATATNRKAGSRLFPFAFRWPTPAWGAKGVGAGVGREPARRRRAFLSVLLCGAAIQPRSLAPGQSVRSKHRVRYQLHSR